VLDSISSFDVELCASTDGNRSKSLENPPSARSSKTYSGSSPTHASNIPFSAYISRVSAVFFDVQQCPSAVAARFTTGNTLTQLKDIF
jgi:hypothetical protein